MSTARSGLSGPHTLQTVAQFATALAGLRLQAGLSVRDVSRKTGMPASTLGGYFSGRHLPSLTQPEVLTVLLEGLGVPAEERADWWQALIRVRTAR